MVLDIWVKMLTPPENREKKLMERFLRARRIAIVRKYITKQSIVCDIGCGHEGYLLHSLSNNFAYGYGFDKEVVKSKVSNIKLINSDIEKQINLASNTIDVIFMLAVIEHLDNAEKLIEECCRMLKNGGKLVITTPTKSSKWLLELLAFKLKLLDAKNMAEHKHYFDRKEITSLLAVNGFKNVSVKTFQLGLNMLIVAQK